MFMQMSIYYVLQLLRTMQNLTEMLRDRQTYTANSKAKSTLQFVNEYKNLKQQFLVVGANYDKYEVP